MKKFGFTCSLWGVFFSLILVGITNAQHPVLEHYTSKDYSDLESVWDITQDSLGIMYFGTDRGVVTYDGIRWKTLSVPGTVVRALTKDINGRIYIGTSNNLGYLQRSPKGDLSFISLEPNIKQPTSRITTIFSIVTSDKYVCFETISGVYVSSIEEIHSPLIFIPVPDYVLSTNVIHNELYITNEEELFRIEDFELVSVMSTKSIDPSGVFSLIALPDSSILAFTLSEEVYISDHLTNDSKYKVWNSELNDLLNTYKTYFGIQLLEGSSQSSDLLIPTFQGVLRVNQSGEVVEHIGKSNVVNDPYVQSLFVSENQWIWMGTIRGVSKTNASEALLKFGLEEHLITEVYTIHKHASTLYVGGLTGIFYKKANDEVFSKINDIHSQIWKFDSFGSGVIVAGGNEGFFYLKNEQVIQQLKTPSASMTVYRSSLDPNRIYLGLYQGLWILRYQPKMDRFEIEQKVEFIPNDIRNIAEDVEGNLWLGTRFDGAYYIPYKQIVTKKIYPQGVIHYTSENGLVTNEYLSFHRLGDTLLFAFPSNVAVVANLDSVLTLSSLGEFEFKLEKPKLKIIDDKLHFLNAKTIVEKSGNFFFVDDSRLSAIRSSINDVLYDGNALLVASNYGLYVIPLLETKHSLPESDRLFITLVEPETKAGKLFTSTPHSPFELPSGKRTFTIQIGNPIFDASSSGEYRFRIIEQSPIWSEWGKETSFTFVDLSPGDYTLELESRRKGREIASLSASFSLPNQWYETIPFYILIFTLFSLILVIIINAREKSLKRRNLKLEHIVTRRTKDLHVRNQLLESKTNALTLANTSKIRILRVILHDLKNPLGVIVAISDLIKQEEQLDQVYQYSNYVESIANKMITNVHKLLRLEEPSVVELPIEKKMINFTSLIDDTINVNKIIAENKSQVLHAELEPDIEFYGDGPQLGNMADNLINNAIKYSPKHSSISIVLKSQHENSTNSNYLIFEVIDHGIGMNQSSEDSLEDHKKEGFSHGLGLGIVRSIVEKHGGTFQIASNTPNSGTRVSVVLPIEFPSKTNSLPSN